MTIQKRKYSRRLSEKDFLRLKKEEPYATYRQSAKSLNFGLLFGMSYKTYSQSRLEPSWTYEQCEQFIDEHDLRDKKWDIAKYFSDLDPHLWSFYTVSQYFRDKFFKTYKNLLKRIDWRRAEGKEYGFIRSLHGAVRHTLPLYREGKDDSRKTIAGYLNIAANTDIQNDEAVRVMTSITEFNKKVKELNLKSRIIGTVHDSVDFIIHKRELEQVYTKIIIPIFERNEEWQGGIKLPVDMTIVDLSKKGHYYKHGEDISEILKGKK